MAEAVNHHSITNGILQAFVAGRKLPGAMIEYGVGLGYHHDAGWLAIA